MGLYGGGAFAAFAASAGFGAAAADCSRCSENTSIKAFCQDAASSWAACSCWLSWVTMLSCLATLSLSCWFSRLVSSSFAAIYMHGWGQFVSQGASH